MSDTLHPECLTACRRGEDAAPCRVIGGCGVIWSPTCVLCSLPLETGHLCQRCRHFIARDLDDIERLTVQAHAQTDPRNGSNGRRSVPGSRPPLVVDALDPELTLIRLLPGDPSSDVPMLEVLESWERAIREDRCLAPYGAASEARAVLAGSDSPTVTLIGVLGFLRTELDWCCHEPSFDLAEYARQLRLCRQAVSRWDTDAPRGGWRVPCPTVTDDGECGRILHVARGEGVDPGTVYCRACERDWDVERLLRVAGRDADVWVDIEAAATLAGVHERTIRKWVARGHVTRRGQLVRVLDVRSYADRLATA